MCSPACHRLVTWTLCRAECKQEEQLDHLTACRLAVPRLLLGTLRAFAFHGICTYDLNLRESVCCLGAGAVRHGRQGEGAAGQGEGADGGAGKGAVGKQAQHRRVSGALSCALEAPHQLRQNTAWGAMQASSVLSSINCTAGLICEQQQPGRSKISASSWCSQAPHPCQACLGMKWAAEWTGRQAEMTAPNSQTAAALKEFETNVDSPAGSPGREGGCREESRQGRERGGGPVKAACGDEDD